MKDKVVVAGSIAYDRIKIFPGSFTDHILKDQLDKLNVSFGVDSIQQGFGGTGGNIAYNLSLLGFEPILLGCVGRDFGEYKKWLKKQNIDISKLGYFKDDLTAMASMLTDRENRQLISFFPGPRSVGYCEILKKIKDIKLLIISPDYFPRMKRYVEICYDQKIDYIFDPGQQVVDMYEADLLFAIESAKAVICNEYELRLILVKTGLKMQALRKMINILIVTKGAEGSEIFIKKEEKGIVIPCAKVKKVLDPTGAGDAYRAGLIKGFLAGWDIKKIGKFAGVVSAYAVEKHGTQNHKFTLDKIKKRLKSSY